MSEAVTRRLMGIEPFQSGAGNRRPVRRTTVRRRRVQKGGSIRSMLSKAHAFVKSKRLISQGLRHFGHNKLAAHAHMAGYGRRRTVRKRRTVQRGGISIPLLASVSAMQKLMAIHNARKQRGGSLRSILSKAHSFVKSKRLISSGLRHFGHHKLAAHAHMAGYGRRRRTVRKRTTVRRQRGKGFFGDVWRGVKKVGNFVKNQRLISKGLALVPHPYAKGAALATGALGLGKRRPRRTVRRRRT